MKSRNTIMHMAIVAVFAGASSMALAANGTLTKPITPTKIGQEYPTTGGLALTAPSAPTLISSASNSFTPSASQNLQVAVTLSGGATFTANPTLRCNFSSGTLGSGVKSVTGTKNYGGAGGTTAIFTITNTTVSAAGLTHSNGTVSGCFMTMNGVTTVTGAHSTVVATINYKYGSLSSASKSGNYITWVQGASASITPGSNAVAQVSGNFVKLTAGITLLKAGSIRYNGRGVNGTTALRLNGTAYTNVSANITTASLTVQGAALSAVTATHGAFLSTTVGSCTTVGVTGGAVSNNSITFNGLTPAQVSAGVQLCLQFTGKTVIPAGSITGTLTAKTKTGYTATTTTSSTTMETISHNGTTLVAPLVQTPSGFLSRLVLTNSGPAATYTVTSTSETGNTATLSGAAASGTIAANSTTVVDLPNLISYTSGQPSRTSLTVNVAGTSSNIKGLYQIVDPAGAVSNYVMVAQ